MRDLLVSLNEWCEQGRSNLNKLSKVMETTRKFVVEKFKGMVSDEKTARNIERSVYNWTLKFVKNHRNRPTIDAYFKMQYKNRFLAMKNEFEKGLGERLQRGEVSFQNLVNMEADHLVPDGPHARSFLVYLFLVYSFL